MPRQEIDERVQNAAQILGLTEYLDRLPKQLSGGQRQRVALGRAIVRDPQVFLMDEPLSNLDAKLRVQMRAEIKKLHQRLQTTFVYVTHDQVEAMTMADRIVLLHEGIIQQYDVPGTIYDRPANTFVATFIGSPPMNLLKVSRSEKGLVLPAADGSEAHPWEVNLKEHFTDLGGEEQLTLGIRPEHILIDDQGKDEPCLSLPCRVDLTEPMGAETYLYLVGKGHSINARVDPAIKADVGDMVTAHIPIRRFHLFRHGDTTRIARQKES